MPLLDAFTVDLRELIQQRAVFYGFVLEAVDAGQVVYYLLWREGEVFGKGCLETINIGINSFIKGQDDQQTS